MDKIELRILIVEPNNDLAKEMATFLKRDLNSNFKVKIQFATDGNNAYALAREWRPQVLISEIVLTIINGWELIRKLRRFLSETLFICVTGIGQQLNELVSKLYEINHYFDKPLTSADKDKIVAAIKDLFNIAAA
jgi:DNA-binding response OmpR family regulator